MAVFARGPGASIMDREKMPTISSSKYWKSYNVQRWLCNDRRVSTGEKDVCKLDIDEVGDSRLRNLERSLRRMR